MDKLVIEENQQPLCPPFPDSSVGKESACNAGEPGSIPGLGRSPGEGIGYPLQYSWASLVAHLVRICLQCGRPGFDLWVGKTPWRRERLPIPIFLTEEFPGLYTPWGHKESDTTKQLSLSSHIVSNNFFLGGSEMLKICSLSKIQVCNIYYELQSLQHAFTPGAYSSQN